MEYITAEELEELNDVYNTIVEFDDIPEISKSIAKLLFMNAIAYAHTREVSMSQYRSCMNDAIIKGTKQYPQIIENYLSILDEHIEGYSESVSRNTIKSMYLPLIHKFYNIATDNTKMPEDILKVVDKSAELVLNDIETYRNSQIYQLRKLTDKLKGAFNE